MLLRIHKKDEVGPCGVRIKPDRPFTEESIKELIHEPEKMSKEERRRFIKAHDGHIGKLLTPPPPREEFFWKAYVNPETGEIIDGGFKEKFRQALERRPGKARHDGFHLAVIERMPPDWRRAAYRLSTLMLVTRTIARHNNTASRVPTPKAGHQAETRPLTLLNDANSTLYGCMEKSECGRRIPSPKLETRRRNLRRTNPGEDATISRFRI